MNWFARILPSIKPKQEKSNVPEGVWQQCKQCKANIFSESFEKQLWVCIECDYHDVLTPPQRAGILFEEQPVHVELARNIYPKDFLNFSDLKPYNQRLTDAQGDDNTNEAIRVYQGHIGTHDCIVAIFNYRFMGGSMGSVVGERFVRGVESACDQRLPFIVFSSSGGARMQEGLTSLFQMAKTTMTLNRLHELKLPFISVLTNPTMGGVAASFAMIGDNQYRRARRAHRVCRTARDPTDGEAGTTAGISTVRISARQRDGRCHRGIATR